MIKMMKKQTKSTQDEPQLSEDELLERLDGKGSFRGQVIKYFKNREKENREFYDVVSRILIEDE